MDKQWIVGGIRHYGLMIGDVVEERAFGTVGGRGTVIDFHPTDNNRAYVREEDGSIVDVICEYCIIIQGVPR